MEKGRILFTLVVVGITFSVSAASISLVADTNIPEPNQEITVYVQTDTSLFAMGLGVYIIGDASITSAMCEADCNQYGWDNGWNSDPYIDPNGYIYLGGVRWDADANGTVGYFKFHYNSGQISVYIDQEYSCAFAFDWESQTCFDVLFSTDVLLFGQPDPNDNSQESESSQDTITDENEPAEDTNIPDDFNLPQSNYWQDKLAERQRHLIHCPPNSNSAREEESFDKAEWFSQNESEIDDGGQMLLDGEPNIIYISSDITTNQIWTANNIYCITNNINIRALLVIEPGTMIMLDDNGGYWDCGIFINNGGTLISKGTPDKPIIWTSAFLYPEYIGYYWVYILDYGQLYFCPIYIEQTASPATTIAYNFIEGAYVGIVTNNITLDEPLENNYLFGNMCGIGENGTKLTDISNNLCFSNYYSGIEVYISDINDVADANSVITIANNTCDDYHFDGSITVHGVADENNAGFVLLTNNIVSMSYGYGLNLVDGYMSAIVSNTGYYYNDPCNKNWDFNEYNPVEANEWPYTGGTDPFTGHYLIQSCPFINAGLEYAEETPLIGKTTDVNSLPDCNKIDIGFHYPNWDYSNAGQGDYYAGDLDENCIIDFRDFAILANGWGQGYDVNDLTQMCGNWLLVGGPEPNITPIILGDSNSGYVNVGASGFKFDTQRIFLLADGEYVGEIFGFWDGDTFGIDVSNFGNEEHQLKLISIDSNSHITCSNINNFTFPCPLNYCVLPESYEPNKPISFSAINNDSDNVTVKVYANGGDLVWSQTYDGNNILGSIPASITNQYDFDYVSFDKSSEGLLLAGGTGWSVLKVIDPVGPPLGDIQALIIVPDFWIRLHDYRTIAQVQNAFSANEINCQKLSGKNATYDNVAWYAANKHIKYIYVDAHGNYQLGKNKILRTVIKLYDTPVVSMKQSDFAPGGAPSWCRRLEDGWENAPSFITMGFNYLEFVYFDCCYSGHLMINQSNQLVEGQPGQNGVVYDEPVSDMSIALGMHNPNRSRWYQGWFYESTTSLWYETDYVKWTRDEWEMLGEGYNLDYALNYAIDGQTEFVDPCVPVNCYRLKGQGWLDDITLTRW